MSTTVKVTGDEHGNVITQSINNPEWGFVIVEQIRSIYDHNGFLRRKVVTALINGTMEDLKAENYYIGQELPGKIVILESLNPANKKDHTRNIKVAGNTGIICTVKGKPVYRKTLYTIITSLTDELVQHDNSEEIREGNVPTARLSALRPEISDEFSI
jgi:hypothetical protein